MPLAPGKRLGPYEIVALIGAGGMGEVYKAHHARLRRTVAIKILPHDRMRDPERQNRFLQEARAASALNHPNIVTLYDFASDSGVEFLVMEYVQGQSLNRLIPPKGMPLVEALGYVRQIAGALAAAHGASIVHRDIKPANVMITVESSVKVLDFGLAKLMERAPTEFDQTLTQETGLTEAGSVMGTVAYMSPEQAAGRPLDSRSDLFSLGVILYELVSGRRPFQRDTPAETMSAIINDPVPPLSGKPPELEEIVAKALAKSPKERYQHAGDFEIDLHRLRNGIADRSLPSLRAAVNFGALPRSQWHSWILCVGVGLLIGASGWLLRRGPERVDNPLANAQFTRFTDFEGAEHDAAISPDGKFVSFVSDRDGIFDIWISQIGSGRFANLTQGKFPNLTSLIPVAGFSADGAEIWLHESDTKQPLLLVPLMGGAPRVFMSRSPANMPPLNASWSPDGTRLVYHTANSGDPIFIADRTGANAHQIFVDRPGIHNHFPTWSRDGLWIYFVRGNPNAADQDIWRIRATGGEPQRLTHHDGFVAYPAVMDRRLLYIARDRDGSGPWLWMVDVESKVSHRVSFGLEQYISIAASADGHRFAATVANPTASLWSVPILDHPAQEQDVKTFPLPTVRALAPRFAGSRLFYLSSRGTGDGLWSFEKGQSTEIWKGSEGALLEPAAVSPDGRRIAIVLRKNGRQRLQSLSAEGGDLQIVGETIDVSGAAAWSPDSKWITVGGNDGRGEGLFKIPVEGGAPVRLSSGPARDPVWSPDGTFIAYEGPDIGAYASLVAIRPDGTHIDLPQLNLRRGGQRIRFLPNGKGIVFMTGLRFAQDFWLLDLTNQKTRPLTQLASTASMQAFDITPDGRQIVFDRLRENSDIVLIDLPNAQPGR